jgi:DNA-binding PadR family transcriptional regulator
MTNFHPPSLPRYPERNALQKLLCGSWKSVQDLQPTGLRVLERMQAKGWLEKSIETGVRYRLTFEGRRAFEAPIPF